MIERRHYISFVVASYRIISIIYSRIISINLAYSYFSCHVKTEYRKITDYVIAIAG